MVLAVQQIADHLKIREKTTRDQHGKKIAASASEWHPGRVGVRLRSILRLGVPLINPAPTRLADDLCAGTMSQKFPIFQTRSFRTLATLFGGRHGMVTLDDAA